MPLLSEQFVDVVIEISDPELSESSILDGSDALGDISDDLIKYKN